MAGHWYALNTRSNFEHRVATDITGRGIECYLPSYEEEHHWKDRKKKVMLPLFPGYLFVRVRDLAAERLPVITARGVVRIVGGVPEMEVDAVRRILDSHLTCHGHPFLRAGMRVRIKRGPLVGLEGFLVRIKNRARLVIAVDLIAQAVATEIDIGDVEAGLSAGY